MLQRLRQIGVTRVGLTLAVCLAVLAFSGIGLAQGANPSVDSGSELLRWWPVLLVGAGAVANAVRTEMLAKSNNERVEEAKEELADKLTFYATTAELGEVRGQVLVAISQLNDLKPTLTRLENKLDAFLIARVRQDEHRS